MQHIINKIIERKIMQFELLKMKFWELVQSLSLFRANKVINVVTQDNKEVKDKK